MILKLKHYSKYCLISIVFFSVFQSEAVFALKEPIIRVLILKNNNIRIRADKTIPLTIKGENFSNKKIKGLTLKNENNRIILYFDNWIKSRLLVKLRQIKNLFFKQSDI